MVLASGQTVSERAQALHQSHCQPAKSVTTDIGGSRGEGGGGVSDVPRVDP